MCDTQTKGVRSSRSFLAPYLPEVEEIKKRKLLPKPEGTLSTTVCVVWFSLPAFQLKLSSMCMDTHTTHARTTLWGEKRSKLHSTNTGKVQKQTKMKPHGTRGKTHHTKSSRILPSSSLPRCFLLSLGIRMCLVRINDALCLLAPSETQGEAVGIVG